MNFTINRGITDSKFSTEILFASYGGLDITPEDEEELLKNYTTNLLYSDITFSGKYNVVDKDVVADETTGETVSFVLPTKSIVLNNTFSAKYEVNVSQIQTSEIQTILNNKELVCQAKIKLFEDKVTAKLTELIVAVKTKNNSFEGSLNITI